MYAEAHTSPLKMGTGIARRYRVSGKDFQTELEENGPDPERGPIVLCDGNTRWPPTATGFRSPKFSAEPAEDEDKVGRDVDRLPLA